jgi:hypothetical protein
MMDWLYETAGTRRMKRLDITEVAPCPLGPARQREGSGLDNFWKEMLMNRKHELTNRAVLITLLLAGSLYAINAAGVELSYRF